MASHDYSPDADCSNSVGSFQCACRTGYTGDGKTCQGKSSLVHAAYKWSDSRVEQTQWVKKQNGWKIDGRTDLSWNWQRDRWTCAKTNKRLDDQVDRSLFKDITSTPVEKYRIKLIDGPINNETDIGQMGRKTVRRAEVSHRKSRNHILSVVYLLWLIYFKLNYFFDPRLFEWRGVISVQTRIYW